MALAANTYKQIATYWPSPSQSRFGGPTFGSPVNIWTRWENKTEQFVDMERREVVSNAVVFTLVSVEIGGYLYLGESVAADPTQIIGAYPIRRVDQNTDLRNLHDIKKVWL